MTVSQTITEVTANKLVEGIHKLDITIAVLNEQMEVQNRWNQEQQKINISVADKLSAMDKNNVKVDARLSVLEGLKAWAGYVFTAVLIVVLIAVVVANLYLTYGGPRP